MSLNDKRYPVNASTDPITETDYIARLSALVSIGRLRNMAPYWLDEAVKHLSKPGGGAGRQGGRGERGGSGGGRGRGVGGRRGSG